MRQLWVAAVAQRHLQAHNAVAAQEAQARSACGARVEFCAIIQRRCAPPTSFTPYASHNRTNSHPRTRAVNQPTPICGCAFWRHAREPPSTTSCTHRALHGISLVW